MHYVSSRDQSDTSEACGSQGLLVISTVDLFFQSRESPPAKPDEGNKIKGKESPGVHVPGKPTVRGFTCTHSRTMGHGVHPCCLLGHTDL